MRDNYGHPDGPKYSSETKAAQGCQLLPLQGPGLPILRFPQGEAPATARGWAAEALAPRVPGTLTRSVQRESAWPDAHRTFPQTSTA